MTFDRTRRALSTIQRVACLSALVASASAEPAAARSRTLDQRHDTVRLCGLVERTPWGFGSLESPPPSDGPSRLRVALRDESRLWIFGCAGRRPPPEQMPGTVTGITPARPQSDPVG